MGKAQAEICPCCWKKLGFVFCGCCGHRPALDSPASTPCPARSRLRSARRQSTPVTAYPRRLARMGGAEWHGAARSGAKTAAEITALLPSGGRSTDRRAGLDRHAPLDDRVRRVRLVAQAVVEPHEHDTRWPSRAVTSATAAPSTRPGRSPGQQPEVTHPLASGSAKRPVDGHGSDCPSRTGLVARGPLAIAWRRFERAHRVAHRSCHDRRLKLDLFVSIRGTSRTITRGRGATEALTDILHGAPSSSRNQRRPPA